MTLQTRDCVVVDNPLSPQDDHFIGLRGLVLGLKGDLVEVQPHGRFCGNPIWFHRSEVRRISAKR